MKTFQHEPKGDRQGGDLLRTLPMYGCRTLAGIPLRFLPIRENFSARHGEEVQFLVVHDTGNPSTTADAYRHYLYFNGGIRNASAHYFVDEKEILQIVSLENAAWHVGDGRGRYGITNRNSVGIELCVNEGGNWEKTKKNAQILLRQLLRELRLPKDTVQRHFDASRKVCPRKMCGEDWKEWRTFWNNI